MIQCKPGFFVVIGFLFLVLCISVGAQDYMADIQIGSGVTFNNIQLWPIHGAAPAEVPTFISLDEGVAAGTVVISEVEDSGGFDLERINNPPLPFESRDQGFPQQSDQTQSLGQTTPRQTGEMRQTEETASGQSLEQASVEPRDQSSPQSAHTRPRQTEQAAPQNSGQQQRSAEEQPIDRAGPRQTNQTQQQIQQVGGGSRVNTLIVENTSSDYLFITAGEIVQGGKQNRVVNTDIIVAPGMKTHIPVYCIESGRWREGTSGDVFSSSENLMSQSSLRKTVAGKSGQGKVWEQVAEINTEQGTENETNNYTEAIEYSKYRDTVKAYVTALLPALEYQDAIGLVVAINGALEGLDVFFSPALFQKLKEKILMAYILEAVYRQHEWAAAEGRNGTDSEGTSRGVPNRDAPGAPSETGEKPIDELQSNLNRLLADKLEHTAPGAAAQTYEHTAPGAAEQLVEHTESGTPGQQVERVDSEETDVFRIIPLHPPEGAGEMSLLNRGGRWRPVHLHLFFD